MTGNCLLCNKEFILKKKGNKRLYCSVQCRHSHWYSNPKNKQDKYNRSKSWASCNPRSRHRTKLKSIYKMSLEQYDDMETDQKGVCKICSRTCPSGRKLSVDHCHRNGKIRGLLCMRCNKALGSFDDNIPNMLKAIKYLEENQ